MNTPPVPDGPDTELAAAIAWFREDPKRLDFAPITEWSRHLRTIVRAYFARPAAGRDLTAGDIWDAHRATVHEVGFGIDDAAMRERLADRLNGIVRPAVARTDGQPPAGEPTPWEDLPSDDRHLTLALCYAARATRDAVRSPEPRLTSTTAAWMAEWLVNHGWSPSAAPADDTAAPGSYIATLIRADEQDQHDAVDPEVGGPTPEYLRGYRAGVKRSAEVAAEALPVPADEVGQARTRGAWVSGASGEPYGPGTVVDVIADEINTTFGMDLSWPKISGTAHRAAARLRREGHLTDEQPPAQLEGQALVDALVRSGWTRTGGRAGMYVRLKRDVPVSNTALVPLDTSASDYTELLDTARAEIGAVSAAPADDTAAPAARPHLCRPITCPGCGSDELYAACCGQELGRAMRECVRCGPAGQPVRDRQAGGA